MGLDLNKRISLVKEELNKKSFEGKVEVAMVLDVSGSMKTMFENGIVQDMVERLLAIGINLDGDKKIESYIFSNSCRKLPEITASNYIGYADREIYKKNLVGGGTNYAPVMKAVADDYLNSQRSKVLSMFKKKSNDLNKKYPLVVFFVTDGDNSDKDETKSIISKLSKEKIFFQFIGISEYKSSYFTFLERLDEIGGRVRDNVNFFNSNDTEKMSDEDLYDGILYEMPEWYKLVVNG